MVRSKEGKYGKGVGSTEAETLDEETTNGEEQGDGGSKEEQPKEKIQGESLEGKYRVIVYFANAEKEAEETARLINEFMKKVEKKLKDKTIMIRGAGNKLPKLKKLKGRWALLADMPVEIGIGKIVGMKILPKYPDLKKTFNVIKNNFNKYDVFYMQIKGPDTYAHLGDVKGKVKAIEKIDKEFISRLRKLKAVICITADHSTECKLMAHSKLPVPFLIYGKGKDKAKAFKEIECKKGIKIYGRQLLKLM